jgi:histone-lysine N-methyltransferase SETD3
MQGRLSAFPASSVERAALPLEQLTEETWLWAFTILFSRAARLASTGGGEPLLALVLYADLLNHSPYSSAFLDAQRTGLPLLSSSQEVAVYADRSYKKFEQVRDCSSQYLNTALAC